MQDRFLSKWSFSMVSVFVEILNKICVCENKSELLWSNCNGTRNCKDLVRKRSLNHLAELSFKGFPWCLSPCSSSLKCYPLLMYLHAKNLRHRSIPSRDIGDQRILQSDWLRAFLAIIEEPDFFQTCGFGRTIKNAVRSV